MMKGRLGIALVLCTAAIARTASADTFAPGSLIVPMDTTYQDDGTLKAFGLVYRMLANGVPGQWVIRTGKAHLGVDFTADAVDVRTNATIQGHGYRGGPFVIAAPDATA